MKYSLAMADVTATAPSIIRNQLLTTINSYNVIIEDNMSLKLLAQYTQSPLYLNKNIDSMEMSTHKYIILNE